MVATVVESAVLTPPVVESGVAVGVSEGTTLDGGADDELGNDELVVGVGGHGFVLAAGHGISLPQFTGEVETDEGCER